jgi:hypothetical protein
MNEVKKKYIWEFSTIDYIKQKEEFWTWEDDDDNNNKEEQKGEKEKEGECRKPMKLIG